MNALMKKARKRKGLTQFELAQLVGLTENKISRLETSRDHPRAEVAQRIANVLGRTVDELFGESIDIATQLHNES